MIEEDVQMPPLRQAEALNKTRVFILEPLAHRRQLLLGELPVFPLSRVPVVGSHAGVRIETGSRHGGRSLVVIDGETGTWDLDHVVEDANSGLGHCSSAYTGTQARRRLVGSVSATGWSASRGLSRARHGEIHSPLHALNSVLRSIRLVAHERIPVIT